jgi:hypothetical protein
MIKLTTLVTIPSLTLAGVKAITGLNFEQMLPDTHLPAAPGVYVWTKGSHPDAAVLYPGSASGQQGLFRRLRDQRNWIAEAAVDRSAAGGDLLDPVVENSYSAWVPLVRSVVEHELTCHFAVIPNENPDWSTDAPADAQQYERLILAAGGRLAANRAPIGGGAWEANTPAFRLAWDQLDARLSDLRNRGVV